jgi:tetratricopeptide (TPR) repeat protein
LQDFGVDYFTLPSDTDPLAHRAESLAGYGVYAFDLMISEWRCPKCHQPVQGPDPLVNPMISYRSSAELEAWLSEALVQTLEAAELPTCENCKVEAQVQRMDYHVFHSGLGEDVVFRWKSGGKIERWRWSRSQGHRPMPVFTSAEEDRFLRDALLRAASAYREANEVEAADEVLLEATQRIPGEPELLRFMPWLNGRLKYSVSGEIANAHVQSRPEDARGHFWMGQVILELVTSRTWPPDALAQASDCFHEALALNAKESDARLGLVNVARVQGDSASAKVLLEALLAQDPGHPEALYTLGLMELDGNPARALECFTAGEAISPRDADYPRGCARALLALQRWDDAREAALRAKKLAPSDPRLDDLLMEAASSSARG